MNIIPSKDMGYGSYKKLKRSEEEKFDSIPLVINNPSLFMPAATVIPKTSDSPTKRGKKKPGKKSNRGRPMPGRRAGGSAPSAKAQHREWLNLIEIEGPFLSVEVLKKAFPGGLDQPEDTQEKARTLRSGLEEWESGVASAEPGSIHHDWVRFVLEFILGLSPEVLRSALELPADCSVPISEHGETLSPDYAVVNPKGAPDEGAPRMLIQVVGAKQRLDAPIAGKRWKAPPSDRMAEMLRGATKKGVPLGLLTNGMQWMLVHAPRGETVGRAT